MHIEYSWVQIDDHVSARGVPSGGTLIKIRDGKEFAVTYAPDVQVSFNQNEQRWYLEGRKPR